MEKTELKELLKESTGKVLLELGKILDKNSSLYNELVILWKRHDEIERNIRLGMVGHQEAGIESNQITNGLLSLIDKIEDKSKAIFVNKNEIKEILIEDAIEWLSNALINQGYYKETNFVIEDNETQESKYREYVNEVNIENDGKFSIVRKSVLSIQYSGKKGIYKSNVEEHIIGKIQDIGKVKIEKDEGDYAIICSSTNYKKAFSIATNTIYEKKPKDKRKAVTHIENLFHEDEFFIIVTGLSFSKKVKNAIDNLAIHFGRKEDAF